MNEIIRKCSDCGKKFVTGNRKKKLCPDCIESHKVDSDISKKEKARAKRLAKKLKNDKLLEDIQVADKLGVSYGQYKAMPEKVKLRKRMGLVERKEKE